jgi:hypothetical protein
MTLGMMTFSMMALGMTTFNIVMLLMPNAALCLSCLQKIVLGKIHFILT